MATRSMIAMKTKEGQYKAIYCHWNGYISGNGKILFEHYKDTKKVEQLLELGDMSMLGEEPTKCVTYKSRGDKDVEARLYKDEIELITSARACYAEYIYLWADNCWYVQKTPWWSKLEYAIEDEG